MYGKFIYLKNIFFYYLVLKNETFGVRFNWANFVLNIF